MELKDQLVKNPGNRFHAMLDAGDPRALARQCTAKSKQTGRRCRNAARKGKRVCGFHGVPRFDKLSPEIAERRSRSAMKYAANDALAAAIEEGLLHEETLCVFRQNFTNRIPQKDQAEFILQLDARLRGCLDLKAWLRVLENFGVRK